MPVGESERRIATTRKLTDRSIGVNIIIGESEEGDRELLTDMVAAASALRIGAVILFWGDPAPYIEPAHRYEVKVLIQVGSVEEARAAAEAGVDGVIAQGFEAGGHVRGTTSIWELLPKTVEALKPLPVLASGG